MNFRSTCPISSALDIVGDKWSLLVLRDMMFSGKKTFGEFAASAEGIATNILSNRLSNLEKAGIINKGKLPDNKKTNIYTLTNKGVTFLPLLAEVILWSDENLHEHITDETKELASKIKQNKPGFLELMYDRLVKRDISQMNSPLNNH
jgi:DNA-binding HxlR family transcriptional regulator